MYKQAIVKIGNKITFHCPECDANKHDCKQELELLGLCQVAFTVECTCGTIYQSGYDNPSFVSDYPSKYR